MHRAMQGPAPQTIEQAVKLLKVPPPWRRQLDPIYHGLAANKTPIDWPVPDSEAEDWIFAASALIFVEPTKSERAQQVLRHALGGQVAWSIYSRFSHLSELRIIGPWFIPVSKSRTTSGR